MVAVPTGVPSARTVALVLAVLGYRRRLRRRDRWSRSALLACPLMMLSTFATTRSSSASHPQTSHRPTPSRLSPSQMPVDRERSLR